MKTAARQRPRSKEMSEETVFREAGGQLGRGAEVQAQGRGWGLGVLRCAIRWEAIYRWPFILSPGQWILKEKTGESSGVWKQSRTTTREGTVHNLLLNSWFNLEFLQFTPFEALNSLYSGTSSLNLPQISPKSPFKMAVSEIFGSTCWNNLQKLFFIKKKQQQTNLILFLKWSLAGIGG